jgi:biotin carboxyl carrier protein
MQYKARINDKSEFTVEKNGVEWLVNGSSQQWDIQRIDQHRMHMIHNNKSYTAEIVSVNKEDKTVQLKINNNSFSVQLSDRFDALLRQLGMGASTSNKINDLKAPMPGLVVKVLVQPGDAVNKGDALLVLEAMKMENMIKATGSGKVKALKISAGTKVEKGELLIQFE